MNTIASILVVLAFGAQAQPLGSVADSQSLVRRTHPKRAHASQTPTFIPVPVFVNAPTPNFGQVSPDFNAVLSSNYVPASPNYNNAPSSNYNPKPDYQNFQAVPY